MALTERAAGSPTRASPLDDTLGGRGDARRPRSARRRSRGSVLARSRRDTGAARPGRRCAASVRQRSGDHADRSAHRGLQIRHEEAGLDHEIREEASPDAVASNEANPKGRHRLPAGGTGGVRQSSIAITSGADDGPPGPLRHGLAQYTQASPRVEPRVTRLERVPAAHAPPRFLGNWSSAGTTSSGPAARIAGEIPNRTGSERAVTSPRAGPTGGPMTGRTQSPGERPAAGPTQVQRLDGHRPPAAHARRVALRIGAVARRRRGGREQRHRPSAA